VCATSENACEVPRRDPAQLQVAVRVIEAELEATEDHVPLLTEGAPEVGTPVLPPGPGPSEQRGDAGGFERRGPEDLEDRPTHSDSVELPARGWPGRAVGEALVHKQLPGGVDAAIPTCCMELDGQRIEAIVHAVADRLEGDWLLVGGALVATWLEPERTTEDVDLVAVRGSPTLFLLLKIGRLTERDLADCVGLLDKAEREGMRVDVDRVRGALDALAPAEEPGTQSRRRRLLRRLSEFGAG
jgi:hypothetical protein